MVTDLEPVRPSARRRVAIVGGGASGVLTAFHLLADSRDPDLEVVIHESTGIVGRGVAYGTNDQRHLLNVRARHMSALPDAPSDLLEWARRTGRSNDPQGFLPRADYAIYLQDRLRDVADDRLQIAAGRVVDVAPASGGYAVVTERRRQVADAVVLCHGNQAPRPLSAGGDPLPDAPWHVANPWDLGRLRTLPADARVVVVGTGLTGVDTAITLLEEGRGRQVVLLSRAGLLPRTHVEQQHTAWVTRVAEGGVAVTAERVAHDLVAECAAAARQGVNWRNVVDGLRPRTQALWLAMSLEERRRFLATYAREWEVRRHRMPPEVALRIERYRLEGRLVVRPGTLGAVEDLGDRVRVDLDQVGAPSAEPAAGAAPIEADAVVNCTGPLTDVRASGDPLLQALLRRGLIAPDPLALGLDATPEGRILDAAGAVVPGLYVVGPPRKGTLWESTAIPEIRAQAAQVAASVIERTTAQSLLDAG